MNLELVKESIETNVYHISENDVVPLHVHDDQVEIFYCIKGSGIGVLDDSEIELNVGDSFVAHAGVPHSIKTDGDLYVTAILIPFDKIICSCKQVTFSDIRKAMASGARSVEDIKEMTGAGTGCGGCVETIAKILTVACGCKSLSMESVINSVNDGYDTIEKLGSVTGAGSECGKCKPLLENIIKLKR